MVWLLFLYTMIFVAAAFFALQKILAFIFDKTLSTKTFLAKTFLAGFIYFSVTLSWILMVYPMNDFNILAGGLSLLLVFYIITCCVSGASFLIFYVLRVAYVKVSSVPIRAILFAILVAALSYVKSLLLWVLYYSPNISFGWYWIFGDPSLSLIFVPYIGSFYKVAGLVGVDIMIGLVVYLLYIYSQNIKYKKILLISVLVIFFLMLKNDDRIVSFNINNGQKDFIIIETQSNTPVSKTEQMLEKIEKTNQNNAFYLAPEDVGYSDPILKAIHSTSASLLYGDSEVENDAIFNGLYLTDGIHISERITEKRFLIPFGEYMPVFFSVLAKFFVEDRVVERLEINRNYNSGRGLSEITLKGKQFLVGLCSDLWSREGLKYAKKSSAETAIIFESNTLFHNNPWFLVNLLAWHKLFGDVVGKKLIVVPNDTASLVNQNTKN